MAFQKFLGFNVDLHKFCLRMNSIDFKSLIIGALLTAVVFLSTGWQSGVQKVEIVQRFGKTLKVELKDGGDRFNPLYVKEVK